MNRSYGVFLGRLSGLSILLGSACLIIAMLLTTAGAPASAADSLDGASPVQEERVSPTPGPGCTPPSDWDQTVRLVAPERTSKEWSFDIDEPEMFVVLEFFYYQDYDRSGCPFDCSTGACQSDETGQGESPLGGFTISDGQLGAHGGKVRLDGPLAQGSYQARFWVTGNGSINIGLRVHRSTLPTDTPVPTDTDTPTPTEASPTPTLTEIPPSETSTPTGIFTPPTATFTATSTATSIPTGTKTPSQTTTPTASFTPTVSLTPTPTATNISPTPTHAQPSKTPTRPPIRTEPPRTPTSTVPAVPELTTTPTSTLITLQTPAGTLPPPTPPSDFVQPPIIVPVTGGELASEQAASARFIPIFLNVGIGLLGIGLVGGGMARWLRREDESLE